ncbi:TonB family protein [Massilia sp. DD77]
MAVARAGRDVEQLPLIARLKRLGGPAPRQAGSYEAAAEEQRRLAQAHLQAGRHREAEQVLVKALAALPTHANFWSTLATALQMQGKNDDAVSALVTSQAWSHDPDEVARGFERVGQDTAFGGALYRAAADAIAANAAARTKFEASLPPVPARETGSPEGPDSALAYIDLASCERPDYPWLARDREAQGKVGLLFYVGADGRPQYVKRTLSSGTTALDNDTVAALGVCRFRPARKDGVAIAGWSKLEYIWRIE